MSASSSAPRQVQKGTVARAFELLEFIKRYTGKYKYAPTVREMANEFNTSTSVVSRWLKLVLVPLHLVSMDENSARSYVVIEHNDKKLFAYCCPRCDFFTSSASMQCPTHPEEKLEKRELKEV